MNNILGWLELFNKITEKPEYAGMSIAIVSGISLIILYFVSKNRKSSSDDIFSIVIKRLFLWMPWVFVFGITLFLVGQIINWTTYRKQNAIFGNLTTKERNFLNQFIMKDTKTIYYFCPYADVVESLEHNGIVLYKNKDCDGCSSCPVVIENWVWDYLKKHPELLKPIS